MTDSKYHGGKMEGPSCRRLARLTVARDAMKLAAEIAKEVPEKEREASDEEIDKYTAACCRLLQLNGMMISLCYHPYKTLTDDQLDLADQIVEKFNDQWREVFENVPPKVHMWDHLLDDLRRPRGCCITMRDSLS